MPVDAVTQFHLAVLESELDELRARLDATRWPEPATDPAQGVALEELQRAPGPAKLLLDNKVDMAGGHAEEMKCLPRPPGAVADFLVVLGARNKVWRGDRRDPGLSP